MSQSLQELGIRRNLPGGFSQLTIAELIEFASYCTQKEFPAGTILKDVRPSPAVVSDDDSAKGHKLKQRELLARQVYQNNFLVVMQGSLTLHWQNLQVVISAGDVIGTFEFFALDLQPGDTALFMRVK